jgi:D-alanyl-D-alanine carboxypeptidase
MKHEPGTIQAKAGRNDVRTFIGRSRSRRRRGHLRVASFLVGVALLIAACSRPGSTAGSSALKPIDQAALQAMVDTTAKELLVPGAVVLLRTPQGEFTVTYGTTQLGTTSPPRADTRFRIASNTKSMTAAVIVQLAQEGKLSLDDPVSKYVPSVPNGDNITIDELLTMRSGLYNYTDAPELAAIVDRDPTKVWTTEEVLAIAFARPPNFLPGTAYEYNNTNYTLLGLIAEQVDGRPLAQAMQERLFGPLGMHDTFLPARTSNTIPDPYSHGYLYGSSLFVLTDTPYPPDIQAAARAGTLLPTDYTGLTPSFAYFPGGVISTASDLAIWIKALVAGRVLNTAYQRRWLDSLQAKDPEHARRPAVRVRHGATALGPERGIFSRRRDPRLQCAHGLRPQQPGDVCDVDQSTHIGRRQVNVNGPSAENMGSDLRGITTDGFPIADRHPLASAS